VPVYVPAGSPPLTLHQMNSSGISFGAGDTVYALSYQRIVRSNDRGLSWSLVDPNLYAFDIIAHPGDPGVFWYHDKLRVWRADSGGTSPVPLANGLTSNPGYTSTTTLQPLTVDAWRLRADPGFPAPGTRLWLGTYGSGLFRSEDAGANWATAHEGLSATLIRALAVNPNPASAAAGGSQGLRLYGGIGDTSIASPALLRTNGLASLQWQVANTGLRAAYIRALAIDPTTARAGDSINATHIYAAGAASSSSADFMNAGVFKSSNNGGNWQTLDNGLPTRTDAGVTYSSIGIVRSIVLDPRSCAAEPRPPQPACVDLPAPGGGDPAIRPLQRVYASASGGQTPIEGVLTTTHRLIRSDDAGGSWTALDTNPGFPQNQRVTIEHEGVSYFAGASIIPVPITISPTDPDLIYVGTYASTSCSGSGGASCPPAVLAQIPDIHSGVLKTTDRGASWTPVNSGLPRIPGHSNTVQSALSMVMHPTNHDVLWVSMTDVTTSDPTLRPISVYKTVDGGATWTPSATGIPQGTDVRALTVDPGDGQRLYAAGSGTAADPGSVYRSTDGGATWMSMSIGLPAAAALALEIDPHNHTVLHAGTDTGVWSIEQVPDADGDGIPDAVENFAPNGGDGNGDGTPDSIQRQVGSVIIILNKSQPATLDELVEAAKLAKSGGGFITTDVLGGDGACAQAVDVQNRLASRVGRDYLPGQGRYYTYPRDLVQFEVLDCRSAVVDVTFHNADFSAQHGWSMRYYGPSVPGDETSIGWHDFSQHAERIDSNTWRLTLGANEFGSYRPVDDRILFVGGPACYDDRVFYNGGFEAATTAAPSCN
jgi:hypothetical protein